MLPGPIPTFTPSAPASASILAASPVATLPTTISTLGKFCLASLSFSITDLLCPWAVSITMASTPASTRAFILSRVSAVTPTPAATRRRPFSSLQAIGLSLALVMSLYVIRPISLLLSSTTGSFSILFSCSILAAATRSVCTCVVTRLSLLITSSTGRSTFCSNLRSLLVTMPTRCLSLSTTGIPPIWYSDMRAKASLTVLPRWMVTGSYIIPFSALFTIAT